MKDYYEILGVDEQASDEEIRARWVELAKRYHPDLGKTKEADEKIKEINEAYEVLKDNSKRFDYDFERNFKRMLIKKAHRPKERGIPIQRIILSASILVLFLIIGVVSFRWFHVAGPPKSDVPSEMDKVLEKETASRIPPVKTELKVRGDKEIPKEIKKEESVKILPKSKLPVKVEKEVPAKEEPKPVKELAPQVAMKSKAPVRVEKEIPKEVYKEVAKKVSREVPKKIPKEVPREGPKEVPKESPKQVAIEVPKEAIREVEKEIPKEVPKEISKEVPKEAPKEVPKESPKQVAIEVPKEAIREVEKEIPKEVPKEISKEVPKEAPKEVPKESPKQVAIEVPRKAVREVAKEVPKEVPKEIPKEVPKEIPSLVPKESPKQVPKEIPKKVAKEVPKELPKEISSVTLHPGERLKLWKKEERVVSSRPSPLAKEEEVKRFFSNYLDRYHKKDIDGFLSFFSSKALQNQKDGLKEIRKIYTKFFDQSQELRYHVKGMKIKIYQNVVDVKARFRVEQRLKKRGEEIVWEGNVRWVLVKEDGNLKISSLDYQNEKIP